MENKLTNQENLKSKDSKVSKDPRVAMIKTQLFLSSRIVGQQRMVEGIVLAVASGFPALIVGPPGTGKTYAVEMLSKLIGGRYGYLLLSKFTEPDEILGPLDVIAYRSGQYRRVLEYSMLLVDLPFFDEVFKSSSAVRNVMLDIMLNKRYRNGNEFIPVRWLTVFGASNEVSDDPEDLAFFDRFVIRVYVNYIPSDLVAKMIEAAFQADSIAPLMSVEDVKWIQGEVERVVKKAIENKELIEKYVQLVNDIRMKTRQRFSDRKVVQTLKLAAALAAIYNADVSIDDFVDAVRYSLPANEDDYRFLVQFTERYYSNSELYRNIAAFRDDLQKLLLSDIKIKKDMYEELKKKLLELLPQAKQSNHRRTKQAAIEATYYMKQLAKRVEE